jgi:hypothetical protein
MYATVDGAKSDMSTQKLTPEIIAAAVLGFEQQKRRIDDQITELRAMLDGGTADPNTTPGAPARKRKKFSAAARKRMKEAQQRRWAKVRGESGLPAPVAPEPEKPKRRISKEGMKRIIAATKKRWAKKRAEAAKTKPRAVKAAVKN